MLNIDQAFIVIMFAVTLVVLGVSTLIELVYKPRFKLLFYGVLRVLALGALFVLFREFWKVSYSDKALKNDVVILNDISGSMEMLPKETQQALKSLVNVIKREMKDEEFKVTEKNFGADTLDAGKKLDNNMKRATALGKALMKINQNYPGSKIVLLSDGCENSGISALAAAHRIKAYVTTVYPVFASSAEQKDASDLILTNVYNSMKGWNLEYCCQLNGTIEQKGRKVNECAVDVYVDNRHIKSEKVKLASNYQNFEVNIPATKLIAPGWHEYRLFIQPLENEATQMNNEARGIFQVFGKNQITIVWHYWDLNLRFLKKALDEKYGKKVVIVTVNELRNMSADQQTALMDRTAFLMIGNVNSIVFEPKTKNKLFKMIKDDKISVFFMNGGCLDSWLNNSLFNQVLPLEKIGKRLASVNPWWIKLKYPFGDDSLLLPVHTAYRFEAKARRYIQCTATRDDQGEIPIIVNKGRVTCIAPVSTWRWFINPRKKVRFDASSFWSYMFGKYSYLQKEGISLNAEPKKEIISRPDQFPYVFTVDDPKGADSKEEIGGVFLMQRITPVENKEIRKFTAKTKTDYRCQNTLDSPGIFWYIAEKRDKQGRVQEISNRFPIQIKDNNRELTTITDKKDLLKQIAGITGGQTFFLTDRDKLIELLKKPRSKLKIKKSHDHNYMFESIMVLLVIVFMGSEWFLRQIEKNLRM